MAENKSSHKLFLYGIIIVLMLFGLVRIIAGAKGNYFRLELFGFIFLLILSVVGFIGYVRAWGERVLFFVFLFYLGNLVLIWYFFNITYLVLLFLSLVGFLMSIPHKAEKKLNKSFSSPDLSSNLSSQDDSLIASSDKEQHSEIFEPVIGNDDEKKAGKSFRATAAKNRSGSKEKKVKYSPGKYVASKRSNVYHEPRCEWAKKIKKPSQVWFKSKEEAWESGYKGHSCIE